MDDKPNPNLPDGAKIVRDIVANPWRHAWQPALLIYIGWQALRQDSLKSLLIVVGVSASLIGIIYGAVRMYRKGRTILFAVFFLTLMLYAWILLGSVYKRWILIFWDSLAFVLGAGFAVTVQLFYHYKTKTSFYTQKAQNIGFIISLLSAWVIASILNPFLTQPLPRSEARFSHVSPHQSILPGYADAWAGKSVGLALSGGGYRAVVFHTGTLSALESLGVKPQVLSTVSGGSIIGAYYALGGDPTAMRDAVAQGKFNLKRELMMLPNALHLALPITIPLTDAKLWPWASYDRLHVQSKLLRKVVFGDTGALVDYSDAYPRLLVATSDVAYGQMIGFSHNALLTLTQDGQSNLRRGDSLKLKPVIDLSDLVSISGAFPLAFPNRKLEVTLEDSPDDDLGPGTRLLNLVDGGVGDNSGLKLLLATQTYVCEEGQDCGDSHLPHTWKTDAVLVSDAGAIFGTESKTQGFGNLARSFDVAASKTSKNIRPQPIFFSASEIHINPVRQFANPPSQATDLWEIPEGLSHLPQPIILAMAKNLGLLGDEVELEVEDGKPPSDQDILKAFEGRDIEQALLKDLRQSLDVFENTSTLNDQLPKDTTNAIFRLGAYLVYLKWPELCTALWDETDVPCLAQSR